MQLQKRGRIYSAVYYDADGKRHRKTTHCTDLRAAESAGRRLERQAQNPTDTAEDTTTLGEALTMLIDEREEQVLAGRRAAGTVHMYRVKAGHLRRIFEFDENGNEIPFRLSRLNAERTDGFVSQRRKEGAKDTTIAKELIALRGALKIAKRRGKWSGDVSAILPIRFAPEYKPRTRALTRKEADALLANLTPDHAARTAFILATSANWGETTRARRDDDGAAGVLIHGTKRTSRLRTVPIVAEWQRKMLDHALAYGQGKNGALFASTYGGFKNALISACDDAGIEVCTSNDLRRTFAHWMRADGVPAELVAPAMGHADTKMVERVYGRMPTEVLAARMAAALIGSPVDQRSADAVVVVMPRTRARGAA